MTLFFAAGAAVAQETGRPAPARPKWRRAANDAGAVEKLPIGPVRRPSESAKVSTGDGTLPNSDGQIWRQYDIRSYTVRVSDTQRPERAIVDWILRETGYEAWHSDTVALLTADNHSLYCYHTPEMQQTVADIVDRFVDGGADSQVIGMRLISIGSPSWREKHQALLQAVATQTQGIQAWVLSREDATVLLSDLRRRHDFREHAAPQSYVQNGQSAVIGPQPRTHTYVSELTPRPAAWPGYEARQSQFDEGFSCEVSPLLSLDGRHMDVSLKCHIDQLEKLAAVLIPVPAAAASRQRVKIEVPQVAQYRLQERFRWPVDRVLVVGLGIAPVPAPAQSSILSSIPFVSSNTRGDVLLFIECRTRGDAQPASPSRSAEVPRGRY